MNYVFIDTCSWIDFACGKNDKSSFDFTDDNRRALNSLIELIDSKEIVLLKNEITDIEFKEAAIEPLITAYKKSVVEQFRTLLDQKVIPHCKDHTIRTVFNDALINVDELINPFRDKSIAFNQEVKKLYNLATPINVSEGLKQMALHHSMAKNHPMFIQRQNNVNDFLILYSIQEWIESVKELKDLDETSKDHAIFFVTKNGKDFGIKKAAFDEQLNVSQLIKPIINLPALISTIKVRQNDLEGAADFLPNYVETDKDQSSFDTPVEQVIHKLNGLIELKKEFFLSFLRRRMNEIPNISKLKYLGEFLAAEPSLKDVGIFPLIRSQNVRNFQLNLASQSVSRKDDVYTKSRKGDILITSFGGRVGEHCLNDVDGEVYVHHSVYVLRIHQERIIPLFLDYFLRCHNLNDYSKGSVIPRLSLSDLKNIHVNLPSLVQQHSLVKMIQEKEKEIEQDILGVKRKIKMLLQ